MDNYYDRYSFFRNDGDISKIPFIKIDRENTDLFIVYDKSKMRFDSLSYKYYGDANYAWLIMLANPQYGNMEFEFKDGVTLRIPYPLQTALNRYEKCAKELTTKN